MLLEGANDAKNVAGELRRSVNDGLGTVHFVELGEVHVAVRVVVGTMETVMASSEMVRIAIVEVLIEEVVDVMGKSVTVMTISTVEVGLGGKVLIEMAVDERSVNGTPVGGMRMSKVSTVDHLKI